jgi:hypothetical protein
MAYWKRNVYIQIITVATLKLLEQKACDKESRIPIKLSKTTPCNGIGLDDSGEERKSSVAP